MLTNILKRAVTIGIFMLVAALLSAIVGFIMAVPVMFLWNWVMPQISEGFIQKIDYLHAWGLVTLIGILFNSGKSGSSN